MIPQICAIMLGFLTAHGAVIAVWQSVLLIIQGIFCLASFSAYITRLATEQDINITGGSTWFLRIIATLSFITISALNLSLNYAKSSLLVIGVCITLHLYSVIMLFRRYKR